MKEESTYLRYDVKTIITVFLLVMVYPVGVIMMFVWMKWSKWVKFLLVLPVVVAVIIPLFILMAAGTMMIRLGNGFMNSGEFRQMRQGMMNRCPIQEKLIERQVSPTSVEIIPLNR